jgi:adenine-specific DNA-methyltransferase
MFGPVPKSVTLLDPGAGVGTLTAAFVEHIVAQRKRPKVLHLVAVEVDHSFLDALDQALQACVAMAKSKRIAATYEVHSVDFLQFGMETLTDQPGISNEARAGLPRFTHVILNPPYGKIKMGSEARKMIARTGLETSNLYTAFLWIAGRLLSEKGELVAITPRSFCNGPYFLPFRERFLDMLALDKLHVFDKRDALFSSDAVLQENIVLHGTKTGRAPEMVLITASKDSKNLIGQQREVPFVQVVHPDDPQKFIHLVLDEEGRTTQEFSRGFRVTLKELGIEVSTGRVVDFRATEHLRKDPGDGTVPLIYPKHLSAGWPIEGFRKYNAIQASARITDQLVPNGVYVLLKRFTSKEERRRVVAYVYDPIKGYTLVGFENHLNYFHALGKPLELNFARGLALFLNSSLVDRYFRQFSGHTQVNATDLRSLTRSADRAWAR